MEHTTWLLFGFFAGIGVFGLISTVVATFLNRQTASDSNLRTASVAEEQVGPVFIASLLRDHLQPLKFEEVTITERQFPYRMRADLQRALDEILNQSVSTINFVGVRKEYNSGSIGFQDCMIDRHGNPALQVPSEFEELDIGEAETLKVLKNGLWLLEKDGTRFAVLLSPTAACGVYAALQIQICTPKTPAGESITKDFFAKLEAAVAESKTYRGKILSLRYSEESYNGTSMGSLCTSCGL